MPTLRTTKRQTRLIKFYYRAKEVASGFLGNFGNLHGLTASPLELSTNVSSPGAAFVFLPIWSKIMAKDGNHDLMGTRNQIVSARASTSARLSNRMSAAATSSICTITT